MEFQTRVAVLMLCVAAVTAACSTGASGSGSGVPGGSSLPSASASSSSSSLGSSSGGASSSSSSGSSSSGAGVAVTVDVSSAVAGAAQLSPAFAGLSWEKGSLSSGLFSSSNSGLVTLFKNLGPSVLRIGGSSVDKTTWDDSGDANSKGLTAGYVAPSDVDRLAGFLQTSGWKVIYGINFATETTAQMASEASYVEAKLGGSLLGFEIGNEPDLYYSNGIRPSSYTYSDFLAEWNTDANAIRSSVPAAVLTGPAAAYNYKNYTVPFAGNEGGNIGLLTQHYYIDSSCPNSTSGYAPSIAYMLAHPGDPTMLQAVSGAASTHRVTGGARIAEANSFYSCTDTSGKHFSGAPGVSNSFASALWAVDFLFNTDHYGLSGINFHSGGSAYYSPIQIASGAVSSVQPEYYGLWLFSQTAGAGPGSLLTTTVNSAQPGLALNAYAVQSQNGAQAMLLLNESGTDATVQVAHLKATATSATLTAMTAPSLSDTTGSDVKINGSSFNTDGTWSTQPIGRSQPMTGGSLTVDVPAGSALLVKVQ